MNHEGIVLVACGEEQRLRSLCQELRADGHTVHGAHSAEEAAIKARHAEPSLLILAPLARPLAQLAWLRAIRAGTIEAIDAQVAVIVLGSTGGELEVVRCLEAGADDYLPPAAGYLELRARLDAVRRRLAPRGRTVIRVGGLEIDARRREARCHGATVKLTRTEFALLHQLAEDPARVMTKHELLASVWGYPADARTRTLDSHAARLRQKLAAAGAPGMVVNVWGTGYHLSSAPPGGRGVGRRVAVDVSSPLQQGAPGPTGRRFRLAQGRPRSTLDRRR